MKLRRWSSGRVAGRTGRSFTKAYKPEGRPGIGAREDVYYPGMKRLFFAFVVSVGMGAVSTTVAYEASDCGRREHACSIEPDEANLTRHCCYTNSFGKEVHAPSQTRDGAPPKDATARCGDQYYSFSEHHSGTCSWHRGVEIWLGER